MSQLRLRRRRWLNRSHRVSRPVSKSAVAPARRNLVEFRSSRVRKKQNPRARSSERRSSSFVELARRARRPKAAGRSERRCARSWRRQRRRSCPAALYLGVARLRAVAGFPPRKAPGALPVARFARQPGCARELCSDAAPFRAAFPSGMALHALPLLRGHRFRIISLAGSFALQLGMSGASRSQCLMVSCSMLVGFLALCLVRLVGICCVGVACFRHFVCFWISSQGPSAAALQFCLAQQSACASLCCLFVSVWASASSRGVAPGPSSGRARPAAQRRTASLKKTNKKSKKCF